MGRTSIGTTFGTDFNSKYWVALDPCGLICVTLSFSIHLSALTIMILYVLCRTQWMIQILFSLFYTPSLVLAVCSLFMVWSTNPGAVPMGARPINAKPVKLSDNNASTGDISTDEDDAHLTRSKQQKSIRAIRRCAKCNNNYKPPRAHHDSVTGRCVVKLDHFCPWVGNAIGVWNHKFFFLFIFYTCLCSFVTIIILATKAMTCDDNNNNDDNTDSNNLFSMRNNTRIIQSLTLTSSNSNNSCDDFYSLPIFYLFTISLLFLFFTCCMLCEQMEPIRKNISKIAALKVKSGQASFQEYASVSQDFNELFGGTTPNVSWHWFLPLTIWFPDDKKRDLVLGYTYDESFGNEPYDEENENHNTLVLLHGGGSSTSDENSNRNDVVIDFEEEQQQRNEKKNLLKNILSSSNENSIGSKYSKLMMEEEGGGLFDSRHKTL